MVESLSPEAALEHFDSTPYDREGISQGRLDLANKLRSSLFPWRGQFSPELIELFLSLFAHKERVILDPFAGSGTTLFEAARMGLPCYGVEINPSAVAMADTAHFVNLAPSERRGLIDHAYALAEASQTAPVEHVVGKLVQHMPDESLTKNILANALIRYMSDGSVTLVVTSPPYINVFNYHQNNRPAMELLGWDLLRIAHSTGHPDCVQRIQRSWNKL